MRWVSVVPFGLCLGLVVMVMVRCLVYWMVVKDVVVLFLLRTSGMSVVICASATLIGLGIGGIVVIRVLISRCRLRNQWIRCSVCIIWKVSRIRGSEWL